jgi:hypothetical protein
VAVPRIHTVDTSQSKGCFVASSAARGSLETQELSKTARTSRDASERRRGPWVCCRRLERQRLRQATGALPVPRVCACVPSGLALEGVRVARLRCA